MSQAFMGARTVLCYNGLSGKPSEPEPAMRLLIIEDEKKTAEYLRKGLAENGYVVDAAYDGQTGLDLALRGTYDLMVLDVNLPGRDGWSLLSELRRQGIKTPVLFLSARDLVSDRVKGLELGADDYLVKPFAFSELLARLKSLSRRGQERRADVLKLGDLQVDLAARSAHRGGKRLDLSPKDFALLSLLMRRQGEVLSRSLILEQVWDMNFDTETNVVDVAIRRLRQKVDAGSARKMIHTVRGAGYLFRLPEARA
jgi:two-component system copper resistance phosphate regulon response regulator CusR